MSGLTKRLLLMLAVFFSAGVLYSAPASAQATRTWVSGVGDDANPCSRTAPCKTFAGAISKTAAGGEIDCLDPAGFGTVTITKSMTIDCRQTQGSVLASSTFGINVNGAGAVVVLRGLSINGAPPSSPGLAGVRVLQAKSVLIEDCIIFGFGGASPNGKGVLVQPNTVGATTNVTILNSIIANNGLGGVHVFPPVGGTVNLVIENSRLIENGPDAGVFINAQPAGSAANARIVHSVIAGGRDPSAVGVSIKAPAGGVIVSIKSSAITDNGSFGIKTSGGITRVADTLISGNGTGVTATGGQLVSFGNNELIDNGTDGTFTSTIPTN